MVILKHIDFQVPDFGELAAGPQLLPGYRSAILADEPIAYWRLGESAGSSAADETTAHHGAYKPSAAEAWTGGALGDPGALAFDTNTAAAFDGSSGFVEIAHHADFNRAVPAVVALEAWVRFDNTADFTSLNYIITKRSSGAGNLSWWLAAGDVAGSPRFILNGAGTLTTALNGNTAIAKQRWYHIAGVINGTTGYLYVDGALDTAGALSAIADTTQPVVLGARSDGAGGAAFHLKGRIDEAAIYPALDAARIATHYRIGVGQ